MKKVTIGIVISISLLVSLLIGTAYGGGSDNGIWYNNSDTIVLNDSAYNVNLGENSTTTYKLKVNGTSYFGNNIGTNGNLILHKSMYLSSNDIFENRNMLFNVKPYFNSVVNFNSSVYFNSGAKFDGETEFSDDVEINGETVFYGNVTFNANVSIISGSSFYYNGREIGFTPLGTIIMWTGYKDVIPDGYALCIGQTVNGVYCPDLRGKFIVSNSSYFIRNSTGGSNTTTLTIPNLPAHTHTYGVDSLTSGSYNVVNGLVRLVTGMTTVSGNTGSTGSGTSFDNKPPYYVLTYLCFVGYT